MSNSTSLKPTIKRNCKRLLRTLSEESTTRGVNERNEETIELIQHEYAESSDPWFIGFSGGKDSSALLKLVYLALKKVRTRSRPLTVVYCDTGVEIPVVVSLVRSTLTSLVSEARRASILLRVRIARPRLRDRYFVKVIGRGYPPPTNKFRWCTDRLRIDPVKRLLDKMSAGSSTVLLGIRNGESRERDKTIDRHRTGKRFFFRQAQNSSVRIFAPIVDYNTSDVWSTLLYNCMPKSIDVTRLYELYKQAGAECPILRDSVDAPCGAGRFGCWTCTVVRKDHAVHGLIEEGHSQLRPLFEFRNWLAEIRDDVTHRCRRRRNGQLGPGPFTLEARRMILRRLRAAQKRVKWTLIDDTEIREIKRLWRMDRANLSYRET